MSVPSTFWPLFTTFLLYGAVLDIHATQFLADIAQKEGGEGTVREYSTYRFHMFPFLRQWIVGEKTAAFMNRRSLYFPLVEVVAALFLMVCAERYGLTSLRMLECTVGATILFMAALIDLKLWIFPDVLSLLLIVLGSVFALVKGCTGGWPVLGYWFSGGVCGFLAPFLLDRFTFLVLRKPGFGIGDMKICCGLGLFLGPVLFLAFFMTFGLVGSVYGIASKFLGVRSAQPGAGQGSYYGDYLATGPSYLAAFLVVLAFPNIVDAYLDWLGDVGLLEVMKAPVGRLMVPLAPICDTFGKGFGLGT